MRGRSSENVWVFLCADGNLVCGDDIGSPRRGGGELSYTYREQNFAKGMKSIFGRVVADNFRDVLGICLTSIITIS